MKKIFNSFFNKYTEKKKKRLGRGPGSGKGKTSGRGHKGQHSRSGVSMKHFEGGQTPIYRRLPKRGFKCKKSNNFIIELSKFNKKYICIDDFTKKITTP